MSLWKREEGDGDERRGRHDACVAAMTSILRQHAVESMSINRSIAITAVGCIICFSTMKFSSAAIILLSAAHSANALVSGPRRSGRPSLQSSKLFSSAAASSHLSVGNSVGLGINGGDNVAPSSTSVASAAVAAEESYKINYGPGK